MRARLATLSRWCDWISRATVLGMVFLVCLNIVLRLLGRPWLGTYDSVSFMGAIIVGLALPLTTLDEGHIAVELFHQKLPPFIRRGVDILTRALSLGFLIVVCWQTYVYGTKMMRAGEITMTQRWPFYPIIYVVSFGCLVMSLVMAVKLLESVFKTGER